MKWLLLLLSVTTLYSNASQCYKLDKGQQDVLVEAYEKGRDHDLGYTMMAIAWEESSAGKYRVNIQSHDFGVMQNSLKTAAARTNTKGYYGKMRLIEDLIKDDNLSMSLSLEELLYWKKQTGTWRNMVSAYNNGWRYNKGNVYLTKIITHVKMFQKCLGGLVDKLEYLNKLHEQYPMPVGATHFSHAERVGNIILYTDWRNEKGYYGRDGRLIGFHKPLTVSTKPIPIEWLMDKYLEEHNDIA